MPAVAAPRRLGGDRLVLRDDQARGLPAVTLLVAIGEALVAQREFEPAFGVQSGMLQRAFELRRVAAQQVERLGALDHEARGDLAGLVDVEAHVDAPELGRIEADLEALRSVLRARHDLDREAGDRHRIVGAGFDPQRRQRRDGRQDRLRGEMERDHRGIVADGADRDRSRRGRRGALSLRASACAGCAATGRSVACRCCVAGLIGASAGGSARRGGLARRRIVGRRPATPAGCSPLGLLVLPVAAGLCSSGAAGFAAGVSTGATAVSVAGFCASCVGAGLDSAFGVSAALAGAASAAAGCFCVSGASVASGRSAGNAGAAALRSTGATSVSSAAGSRTRVDRRDGRDRRRNRRRNVDGHGLRRDNAGFDVGFAAAFAGSSGATSSRLLSSAPRRLRAPRRRPRRGSRTPRRSAPSRRARPRLALGCRRDRCRKIGHPWPAACRGKPRACRNSVSTGCVGTLRVIARASRLGPAGCRRRPDGHRCARSGLAAPDVRRAPRARCAPGAAPREVSSKVSNASFGLAAGAWRPGTGSTHGPQGDRIRHDFGQGSSSSGAKTPPWAASRGPCGRSMRKSFKISMLGMWRGCRARRSARHRLQPGGKNCRADARP